MARWQATSCTNDDQDLWFRITIRQRVSLFKICHCIPEWQFRSQVIFPTPHHVLGSPTYTLVETFPQDPHWHQNRVCIGEIQKCTFICGTEFIFGNIKIYNFLFFISYSMYWVEILPHWKQGPGGWCNMQMPSCQYRNSHCGDKTILRPSYLHNGFSYTCKMTSLHWIRALFILHCPSLWR